MATVHDGEVANAMAGGDMAVTQPKLSDDWMTIIIAVVKLIKQFAKLYRTTPKNLTIVVDIEMRPKGVAASGKCWAKAFQVEECKYDEARQIQ